MLFDKSFGDGETKTDAILLCGVIWFVYLSNLVLSHSLPTVRYGNVGEPVFFSTFDEDRARTLYRLDRVKKQIDDTDPHIFHVAVELPAVLANSSEFDFVRHFVFH